MDKRRQKITRKKKCKEGVEENRKEKFQRRKWRDKGENYEVEKARKKKKVKRRS